MRGKMPTSTEQDVCNYFILKSKDVEDTNISEARAWLLTGRSLMPKNYRIQLQSYMLEKRQRNEAGCARSFESLFRMFPMELIEEVNEMTNAVKSVTLTPAVKNAESEEFLNRVFKTLPVAMQMEVLMHRSEHTPVLLEKCQSVLLMVKLFPDVINQHGGNMLYTLSGCDADVYSPFRSHLVTELVPTVLRLCSLQPSPALITLLNQCIEYYVLVDSTTNTDKDINERWSKLHEIVDQIGVLLKWNIAPFFTENGSGDLENMYKTFSMAVQHRNHYSPKELAYIAVIIFLQSIINYSEKLSTSSWKFGDAVKLTLVEVFVPPLPSSQRDSPPDSTLPVLTTVSPCANCETPYLLQYFSTASSIWQMMRSLTGDVLEKEFFAILTSMTSLNFEKWSVFQHFDFDYKSYTGSHNAGKFNIELSTVKLASMYCELGNYQTAAEYAIKAVQEANHAASSASINSTPLSPTHGDSRGNPLARSRSCSGSTSGSSTIKSLTSFSFYNCSSYSIDNETGFLVPQRRVHFISENKSEIMAYAVNILIQCLQSSMDIAINDNDDHFIGHLMTLLQLEWYSPPAEMLLTQILEAIRTKGCFRYFPYFVDYIIEGDILEQFMALANIQKPAVTLDIFSPSTAETNVSSSRRVGTRGVERGVKNDLKALMQKQMLKSGQESVETLLTKFLVHNKKDIIRMV